MLFTGRVVPDVISILGGIFSKLKNKLCKANVLLITAGKTTFVQISLNDAVSELIFCQASKDFLHS